ncbi:MAG TPA: hypothetical protein VF172_10370 [Nitrososphaera sp.]|jgi:hypothetical protein
MRAANEVSEDEINSLLQAIKDFEGYPKLKDLRKLAPSLTPVQINVIVRFLERSGEIIVDTEGYIVWTRKEQEQLTLGDVARISNDLKEYLSEQSQ